MFSVFSSLSEYVSKINFVNETPVSSNFCLVQWESRHVCITLTLYNGEPSIWCVVSVLSVKGTRGGSSDLVDVSRLNPK